MRVFISIDMEGVAGISDRRQVNRGTDDYPEARRLMAGEANVVAAAAFDAGATTVVVNDAHGDMCNLQPSDVDPRAQLQIGSGKGPNAMVYRVEDGYDAAVFVGYHAPAGTADAVLEHTYSSATLSAVRVNGEDWGETEFNAAVLGALGIPVVLVSGDDKTCAIAAARLPGVRTVEVKTGLRNRASRSLSPQEAHRLLRAATAEALTAGQARPFMPEGPFALEFDFLTTAMTESAALVPVATRTAARTVSLTAEDIEAATRWRAVITTMAASALT